MGERKVINNYIPPDFDPSIIPKSKRDKNRTQEIRMMLPFSMQCNVCSEYMYRGKKFNSKKEDCKEQENYLGIRRFRFYIKCSVCSNEITFKTDPKNMDYELESGASRNFEVWRETEQLTEEERKKREEEDEYDNMRALENRTLDSKIEMDVLDALDAIKAVNQRHERVDTNKVLGLLNQKDQNSKANTLIADRINEDEELIKSIKFKSSQSIPSTIINDSGVVAVASGHAGGGGESSSSSSSIGLASIIHRQIKNKQSGAASATAPAVIMIRKRKIEAKISSNEDQNDSKRIDRDRCSDDRVDRGNTGSRGGGEGVEGKAAVAAAEVSETAVCMPVSLLTDTHTHIHLPLTSGIIHSIIYSIIISSSYRTIIYSCCSSSYS